MRSLPSTPAPPGVRGGRASFRIRLTSQERSRRLQGVQVAEVPLGRGRERRVLGQGVQICAEAVELHGAACCQETTEGRSPRRSAQRAAPSVWPSAQPRELCERAPGPGREGSLSRRRDPLASNWGTNAGWVGLRRRARGQWREASGGAVAWRSAHTGDRSAAALCCWRRGKEGRGAGQVHRGRPSCIT